MSGGVKMSQTKVKRQNTLGELETSEEHQILGQDTVLSEGGSNYCWRQGTHHGLVDVAALTGGHVLGETLWWFEAKGQRR